MKVIDSNHGDNSETLTLLHSLPARILTACGVSRLLMLSMSTSFSRSVNFRQSRMAGSLLRGRGPKFDSSSSNHTVAGRTTRLAAGNDHLRDGLLEDVVGSVSRPLVLLIEHPGGALVQVLQLLVLTVVQHLGNVPQDAVDLRTQRAPTSQCIRRVTERSTEIKTLGAIPKKT